MGYPFIFSREVQQIFYLVYEKLNVDTKEVRI